jgi:hypothetical protein
MYNATILDLILLYILKLSAFYQILKILAEFISDLDKLLTILMNIIKKKFIYSLYMWCCQVRMHIRLQGDYEAIMC